MSVGLVLIGCEELLTEGGNSLVGILDCIISRGSKRTTGIHGSAS